MKSKTLYFLVPVVLLLGGLGVYMWFPSNVATAPVTVTVIDDSDERITISEPKRIVTVGSDITEIVYALGAGDRLIATDDNSTWPEDAARKATLGQRRKLSSEGILSHQPDLILLSRNFGPPQTLEVLKASGTPVVLLPEGRDREGIREKIRMVGKVLNSEQAAEALVARSDAQIEAVATALTAIPQNERKRVIFVHSVAGGKASSAAGGDTPAGLIIELAGGINALANMSGYKQASAEALIAGAPDVMLMTTGPEGGRNLDEVFAVPGLQGTPAARDRALIQLDAPFMLGFGPRTGEAIRALALELYPNLVIPVVP